MYVHLPGIAYLIEHNSEIDIDCVKLTIGYNNSEVFMYSIQFIHLYSNQDISSMLDISSTYDNIKVFTYLFNATYHNASDYIVGAIRSGGQQVLKY